MARASSTLAMLCAKRAGDVLIVGRGQLLLRLNHFDVVGHAGGEAVLRLRQGLLRKIKTGLGDLDLLRGGIQIQDGILHFLLDARLEVVNLRLALLQHGIGLLHVSPHLSALENGNIRGWPRPEYLGAMSLGV